MIDKAGTTLRYDKEDDNNNNDDDGRESDPRRGATPAPESLFTTRPGRARKHREHRPDVPGLECLGEGFRSSSHLVFFFFRSLFLVCSPLSCFYFSSWSIDRGADRVCVLAKIVRENFKFVTSVRHLDRDAMPSFANAETASWLSLFSRQRRE